jgi:recombination protein RecT
MGDPGRLLRIAYNNVAFDSALLECSSTPAGMASIFGGVMEALKLGLTIGGPMQESWLIPFNVKGTKIATLIIGYQGFRNILDRGKSVIDLHPVAVYSNDEFDYELGSRPYVKHKPRLTDRGELIAVYAVAHLPRGGIQLEVMGKAEVDQHRAKSRAGQTGPWVDHYEAMALKTVVRKISKYLPKSSEILARAIDLDDRADRGVEQNFDLEGMVFDTAIGGGVPMKQVGGTNLDKLKAQLTAGKLPGGPPMTPDQKAEMEVGATMSAEEIANFNAEALAEKPVLVDPEQARIERERAEIERMSARMREKAADPATNLRPAAPDLKVGSRFPAIGEDVNIPDGMEPLFDRPPDKNAPIGPEKAKELLEKIRGGKK